MSSAVLLRTLAVPALLVLALAGCAPTAPGESGAGDANGSDTSGDTGTDTDTNADADATGCASLDTSAEPKLALGETDLVSAGPAEGQPYGDGTPFSVTLSEAGIATGYLPMFELYGPTDTGDFTLLSSLAFDPDTGDDGTYSTAMNEFGNDEYVGEPVIATVFAIDTAIEGSGGLNSDNYVVLANYCITYAH